MQEDLKETCAYIAQYHPASGRPPPALPATAAAGPGTGEAVACGSGSSAARSIRFIMATCSRRPALAEPLALDEVRLVVAARSPSRHRAWRFGRRIARRWSSWRCRASAAPRRPDRAGPGGPVLHRGHAAAFRRRAAGGGAGAAARRRCGRGTAPVARGGGDPRPGAGRGLRREAGSRGASRCRGWTSHRPKSGTGFARGSRSAIGCRTPWRSTSPRTGCTGKNRNR